MCGWRYGGSTFGSSQLCVGSSKEAGVRGPWSKQLSKKKQRGYPAATIAFYGPNDRMATKVVVGIVPTAESRVTTLEKWFSDDLDIRVDPGVGAEVLGFIRRHGVRTVATPPGIFGCPHEEGVDYPAGEVCPACPYWANRDRYTHELNQ
jgi:hypothetical protein